MKANGQSQMANLHAAALGRTATVVRHRRNVTNAAHLDTSRGERTDRRFTARAGTGDAHIDRTNTVVAGCVGCANSGLLRCKRSSLTRTAEAERTRALPGQRIAGLVGDSNNRVVEAGLNKYQTKWNILPLALLELLILASLAGGCFILSLRHGLFRRFLLTGDSSLAWTFAGTSVGVGALAADRKRAAVTKTTVGLNFDEALDVERDVLAEIAFNLPLCFDN